jgi:threonine dehydrogenase-like Zn-dependent dehydrogenase
MNRKVTVVGGAGNVGATVARSIAQRELADVVVVDIADTKAAGVALDLYESCPIEGSASRVIGVGTKDFAESANSDVVVITSGMPRKPGMSRDDLLNVNYKIMQDVTAEIVKHSPNCIIVPVANPLDAMSQAVFKLSKFPRERVIGMAGVLDSARMSTFIAMELNVSVEKRLVVRPRRPRRHHGAPAALHHRGRHSDYRADVRGSHQGDLRAHRQRRRRDHQAGRHERLVCAGRVGGADGRSDPEGSAQDHAVLGVPAG